MEPARSYGSSGRTRLSIQKGARMFDTPCRTPSEDNAPECGRYAPALDGLRGVGVAAANSRPVEDRAVGESPGFSRGLVVAALTVVAGILHFSCLGRPCLWLDEAATYWRVCGTFRQMLRALRYQGFVPLHYIIEWAIGRFVPLTPAAMRFYPAICGTLMVPAMYVLTSRLIDRRTALRVAALTAFSGFLFEFSRDAKMYMPFWLLIAIHLGALLKWIDDGRLDSWIRWVVSGALMLLMHSPGLMIVALEPAALALSAHPAPRRWRAFLLGLLLLTIPLAVYYVGFNRFGTAIHDKGWKATGLEWIGPSIAGHSGMALALNVEGGMLTGWSWIHTGVVSRALLFGGVGLYAVTGFTLALGLVPWSAADQPVSVAWRARRAAVLIAIWIVAPLCVGYCVSVPKAAPPLGFLTALGLLAWWWLAVRPAFRPCADERRRLVAVVGVAIGICLTAWIVCRLHPMKPLWATRYFGFTWPAVAMAACSLIGRIPWGPARHGIFTLLLAANLGQCIAWTFVASEPPRDRIALDIVASQSAASGMRAFVDPACYDSGRAFSREMSFPARYYLFRAAGISVTPAQFYDEPLDRRFVLKPDTRPASVASDLVASPGPTEIVVWDSLPPQNWDQATELDALLGRGWKRQSCEIFPVRTGANWAHYFNYRRVSYVRAD
jgi:hypothetical protein